MKLEFSRHIFQKQCYQISPKIHPVKTDMLHASGQMDGRADTGKDRQRDKTKLKVAVRNISERV